MKEKNAKLLRWSLQLQEFNFTIEHVKGVENGLPDALSRNITAEELILDETDDRQSPEVIRYSTNSEETPALLLQITSLASRILEAQEDSDHMQRMINQWERVHRIHPNRRSQEDDLYYRCFTVRDGHIYEVEGEGIKPLVPDHMVPQVLREFHDSNLAGHPGRDETLRSIRRRYFWSTMRRDVTRYVQQCEVCIRHKKFIPRHKETLQPRQINQPWDTMAIDLMGPYPETPRKKKYIFTVMDVFSKWLEAFPLGISNVKTLTQTLEREIFPRYGYPRVLLSDNGPQFMSQHWAKFCDRHQIKHHLTPTYHPRANPVERKNQDLKIGLRLHLLDQPHNNWDQHVPQVLYTLRTRRNEATLKSPSEILFGTNLTRPGDWDLPPTPRVEDPVEASQERQAEVVTAQQNYNQQHYPDPDPPLYTSGQVVFLKTQNASNANAGVLGAFKPRWQGPYTIVRRAGAGTYIITDGTDEYSQHADRLRPAPRAPPNFDPFADEEDSDQDPQ